MCFGVSMQWTPLCRTFNDSHHDDEHFQLFIFSLRCFVIRARALKYGTIHYYSGLVCQQSKMLFLKRVLRKNKHEGKRKNGREKEQKCEEEFKELDELFRYNFKLRCVVPNVGIDFDFDSHTRTHTHFITIARQCESKIKCTLCCLHAYLFSVI